MYASITYKATADQNLADVLDDIVKLMTGETNKANLSAQVVQEGTDIISTIAAGWSLEQTVSPTDVVLKAPISDDPTKFKYVRLTAGVIPSLPTSIVWEAYHDWTVATSSGTVVKRYVDNGYYEYPTNTSNSYKNYAWVSQTITTDQTNLLINVTPNHFMFQSRYGASYVGQSGPSILSEHTRNDAWDTVANGFPPYALSKLGLTDDLFTSSSFNFPLQWIKPRIPNGSGGNTDNPQVATLTPYGASGHGGNFTTTVRYQSMIDANLNTVPMLIPFGCVNYGLGVQGGDMSAKSGMYLANLSDPGITGDVFVHEGVNYRIQRLSSERYGNGVATSTLVVLCKEA